MPFRSFTVPYLIFIALAAGFGHGLAQAEGIAPPEVGETLPSVVVSQNEATAPTVTPPATTVVSEAEIQRYRDLEDLLRTQPGLAAVGSRGPGSAFSVFIRGAKSEHTLVLIDGVEINEIMSTARGANFNWIALSDLERIEIVRGPQSVQYGSDAIGGVIHFITKRGARDGGSQWESFAKTEWGSYESGLVNLGVRKATPQGHFGVQVDFSRMTGFSAADEAEGNSEADGNRAAGFAIRGGSALGVATTWDGQLRYRVSESDLDATGGPGGDAIGMQSTTALWLGAVQTRTRVTPQVWDMDLAASFTRQERNDRAPDAHYLGNGQKIALTNHVKVAEAHRLSLGLLSTREAGESAAVTYRQTNTQGAFLQHQLDAGALTATAGARLDWHSQFQGAVTYRFAPAYYLATTRTRLKGAVGTGFKAPTLFQLYSTTFGNAGLQPERSFAWEAGMEQGFAAFPLQLSVTYFDSRFSQFVDFNTATSRYHNTGEASSRGIEAGVTYPLTAEIQLSGVYTYTRALDEVTGLTLLRRPRDTFTLGAAYDGMASGQSPWSGELAVSAVGARPDLDPVSFARVELPFFYLVSARLGYAVTERIEVYVRGQNLLNRHYQEVAGYGTPKLSAFVGAQAVF